MILRNFDGFAITYLKKSRLLQTFHFQIQILFNSLQTQGHGASFQVACFLEFRDENFSKFH